MTIPNTDINNKKTIPHAVALKNGLIDWSLSTLILLDIPLRTGYPGKTETAPL